ISVLPVELAKELIATFTMGGASDEQEEESAPPPPVAPPPPPPVAPQPQPQQQPVAQPAQSAQPQYAPQPQYPQQSGRVVEPYANVTMQQPTYESFDSQANLSDDQNNNLNMIMSIPLQVTVEIGRTKKKIKEILEFSTGTIIELNKQAGTQVDVFVNGQAVAKGDVVVVDDYYGVRITEVSSNSDILKLL
ncbi:MAG: flagellar motor switch protein FliN, partial [Clostridia bacterium]